MSPAGCGGAGCPFRSGGGQALSVCRCFDARAFQDPARRRETAEAVRALVAERDRLQRACDEGLPREVIHCPACKTTHVEGPRHDDPTKDGRTRPHHTHRCYDCGHVWDAGRWSFGVAPGGENEVTKRLRAEGRTAGLREALEIVLSYQHPSGSPEPTELDHIASAIGAALSDAEASHG